MQFIDLGRQYQRLKDPMDKAIQRVLNDHHYIMGPQVEELEEKLKEKTGRRHCLTTSSGTSALYLILKALDLQKEDACFVSTFTYFASAEAPALAGGHPVFVDSDRSYNMDPEDLEKQIRAVLKEGKYRPRLVIAVDLFGLPCDYDRILPIAEKYGLFVLTDSAQAFGSTYKGKSVCSYGNASATSFFPAKPLGCYGDGGAIFTDDDQLAEKISSLRVHGKGKDKYDNVRLGINGRLDTIQAAVLLVKLGILDDEIEKRQVLAGRYQEALADDYDLPLFFDNRSSALAQYTLMVKGNLSRDKLVEAMKASGIPIMVYYPKPMHMQTAFQDLSYQPEDLPVSLDLSKRVFSIPIHPYLTEGEFQSICQNLITVSQSLQEEVSHEHLDCQ